MGTGWQGTRHLPPDWVALRTNTIRNAGGQCQANDHGQRCTTTATEVDHITPLAEGGTHDPANLCALCQPHHAIKSEAERLRGIARQPRARRAPERHPDFFSRSERGGTTPHPPEART